MCENFFLNLYNFADEGQVAFVSAYGIHQLHIFIFVLAVFHVLYCIITLAFGRIKMRKWKVWEDETKRIEYLYNNGKSREVQIYKGHIIWKKAFELLEPVCFFRQFFGSVTKVDYLTLRHGFIMAHLAPESETKFDFQKYISRSLEEDFKVVVGIKLVLSSPIILMVGAKLQVIITKMGLRIQERGDIVKGAPLVQPGDDLFWFGRPGFMLFLIHFVLFQNAFQLAFFAWSTYEFKIKSCFHSRSEDIAIRLSMGIIIQILCSYVTLPLYALVTQMGSNMRPTIFHDRVATALKKWHHSAKKNKKHNRHSEGNSPFSSRPATPTYGMSPVHLLHNYRSSTAPNSMHTSPRGSNVEINYYDPESSPSPNNGPANANDNTQGNIAKFANVISEEGKQSQEPSSSQQHQHEVQISLSEFSFGK
ncbi:MLO-like protein 12 [Morus notabilis]|uniref:MLO-like protein n=1 Tax=Morus notabilis TaxID=981085 RepID=W9RAQ3_9ROSA|nr:MLO-like protein 12 [Morus notabilis]